MCGSKEDSTHHPGLHNKNVSAVCPEFLGGNFLVGVNTSLCQEVMCCDFTRRGHRDFVFETVSDLTPPSFEQPWFVVFILRL